MRAANLSCRFTGADCGHPRKSFARDEPVTIASDDVFGRRHLSCRGDHTPPARLLLRRRGSLPSLLGTWGFEIKQFATQRPIHKGLLLTLSFLSNLVPHLAEQKTNLEPRLFDEAE